MGDGQSTRSPELPDEVKSIVDGFEVTRFPYYETAAEIYTIESGDESLFLKIVENQSNTLEKESRILEWINGRIPTPKLVYYREINGTEYQITSKVQGTPTYKVESNEREHAVRTLAEALNLIHSLDPTGCPYDNRIENRLNQLESKGVDISGLNGPTDESLVFTHGDYCLPNIIMENRELRGVIDWDYGGLADPYADFASCVWSMGYNYGLKETAERWEPYFFIVYGLDKVDVGKLSFYRKLNELL